MLQLKITSDLHRQERRKMVRQLKKIWAVHHMLFVSDSEAEIAAAVNVGVARLRIWKQTKEWHHAVAFWNAESLATSKDPCDSSIAPEVVLEARHPETPEEQVRSPSLDSLKAKWCVHFMICKSELIDDICHAVNIEESTLWRLYKSTHWVQALDYWHVKGEARYHVPVKDEAESKQLKRMRRGLLWAERCWTEMIENGYDLFPSEMENFIQEHRYLRSEDEIGLEALLPGQAPEQPRSFFLLAEKLQYPKRIWIHDIISALWCIAGIVS